ncbi:glucosyltransferase [Gordonia phage Fryberger]|uniref:Glycosyltransferase n=1 Tax=Gordonia phage Fryberger TaxID=2250392 RepID=A0A346FCT6_9CAUD|nr:glucosyltransferase [Gordonia phage Fryberger]AXN53550.1 glycosyltransferase [Gordonia phage Fryberger]
MTGEMLCSTAIVAHPSRKERAEKLATLLPQPNTIVMDSDNLGPGENHWRAWVAAYDEDAEWILVVEDDALPIDGFEDELAQVLSNSPSPVVSLYLGQSRPFSWQHGIGETINMLEMQGDSSGWLLCQQMLHGVGIAIRTDLVTDMLTWAPMYHTLEGRPKPYDEAIGMWCRAMGLPIAYPFPSILDHDDTETLVAHVDKRKREVGTRIAWKTGKANRDKETQLWIMPTSSRLPSARR